MTSILDYGNIMDRTMRFFVKEVLQEVADRGLPGKHHFVIILDTKHPKIKIAPWLMEKYPNEMTIIIQHWFDNLEILKSGFSITLNFANIPELLYIPYDSIITFVDPSVEFSIKFDQTVFVEMGKDLVDMLKSPRVSTKRSEKMTTDAEVVQLDTFRK